MTYNIKNHQQVLLDLIRKTETPNWDPADSTRFEPKYLKKYVDVDNLSEEEAKNQATSWGRAQIMGQNLRSMGYKGSFNEYQYNEQLQGKYENKWLQHIFNRWNLSPNKTSDWPDIVTAWNAGSPDKIPTKGHIPRFMGHFKEMVSNTNNQNQKDKQNNEIKWTHGKSRYDNNKNIIKDLNEFNKDITPLEIYQIKKMRDDYAPKISNKELFNMVSMYGKDSTINRMKWKSKYEPNQSRTKQYNSESPESDDLYKLFQEYIDALNAGNENEQQAMNKYNEQIAEIFKIIKGQFFEFDPTDPKMNQTLRIMRGPTMQKLNNQMKINKDKYIKGLYSHLFHGDNQLLAEAMNDTKTTRYIADKLNQGFDIALNPNADINARKAAARYLGEGLLSKDYGQIKAQAIGALAGFAGVFPQLFSAEGSLTQMMLQNQRGGQISDKERAAIWQYYLGLDEDEKREFEKTDTYQMMIGNRNNQSLLKQIQEMAFANTVGDTDEI